MDESLLGPRRAVSHDDDEEELWNALNDDQPAPLAADGVASAPSRKMHAMHGIDGGGGNRYERDDLEEGTSFLPPRQQLPTPELPSLRSNVHLPAITALFQSVTTAAKRAVSAIGGVSSTDARNSGGDRDAGVLSSSPSRISNAPDQHGRVANVDAFLINLYNYFYHKGLWSIGVVEIVSLFTGLFTVSLSSFLLGCVQWAPLLDCHKRDDGNKDGCKQDLEQYITCRADQPGVMHLVIGFYFAMFLVYWLSRVLRLIGTLQDAHDMRAFYTERLHIDERQLQTVTWDEVVNRVLGLIGSVNVPANLKQLSSYRLQIDSALLSSPHDFARRILRRENYLIAFMSHELFQGSKLLPPALQFASTSHVMFSRNMEANLTICLINQLFDGEQNLSMAVLNDVAMLQKRFMIAGILNLVLTPFILLYRLFHFLFMSAQEWHSNRVLYFGSRRWSTYAQWKFREYNELPHVLEARITRSYPLAEQYLSMFPAGLVAVVAGGVAFCASSLMAALIMVSLLEESILLETTLNGRQLLWYLTISTGIFALARSFTTQSSPFSVNGDCEEAMLQLSAETHYFPKEWRGQCQSYDVRDSFLALFPFKAVLFAEECMSVIMAPYILCVSLPQCTRELLLFIRSHSLSIPNGGAVCRFAEFDFKRYGNDTKMESSFINFKQNHPTWVGADEGEVLMQRLGRVKEEEMERSMRMGDTMMFGSGTNSITASQGLSMSQQLMQSQAIHTALGMNFRGIPAPQENEFYWLEKLHQRGQLNESSISVDSEAQQDQADHLSVSSVRV